MAEGCSPLPSDRAELDQHIAEFESWFVSRQRRLGMEGAPLMSVEHAILRSYISWLRECDASDPTQ